MHDSLGLAGALCASVVGMAWIALSMDVHWHQVFGPVPFVATRARRLRAGGLMALLVSWGLCLAVDHASMATLVWTMALAGAAMAVAFTLSWRPRLLRWCVPWAGRRRQ